MILQEQPAACDDMCIGTSLSKHDQARPVSRYCYMHKICRSAIGVLQVSMGFSCILGLTVSHSTFVCTRVNDPIMTSTAGNLKNVIMTIIGAFAFGDFRFSVWNSIGLVLSMVGAIWYAAKSAMKVIPFLLHHLVCLSAFLLHVVHAVKAQRNFVTFWQFVYKHV